MARFLFATWPFPGDLFPSIAIARVLREQGHECAFYTGADAARLLKDEHFPRFPFLAVNDALVRDCILTRQRGSWRWQDLLRVSSMVSTFLLDTIPQQVEDLDRILAEWPAHVLVSHSAMMGPTIVLREKNNIPVAVYCPQIACPIPGPDAPPFGWGLPRPRKWHARLAVCVIRAAMKIPSASFRRRASEIRRYYGLPKLQMSVAAFAGTVPLYLMPGAPAFDYCRTDLPPSVRYVGSCVWNERGSETSPEWINSLSLERPWIVVSEGTIHIGDPFLLRAAAQGLANLPVEVILTTGGERKPEELRLGPLASNIHVVRWISHSDILRASALMITTGGAGTILAALSAGVPLIVVPPDLDKLENAQRVVEAGAGLRISPKRCTSQRVYADVLRVLNDCSFPENAKRLSLEFDSHGGVPEAARLLEQLAEEQRTTN